MEEVTKYFQRLGLTQYESAALAAINARHDADAQQISEIANIPYTKVYAVLTSLEKQGFLNTTLERPKKYRPVSPEFVINSLLKRRKEELKYIEQRSEGGLEILSKLYNKGQHYEQEGPVMYLPTREAVFENILDVTRNCKKSMYSIAFASMWNWFVEDREIVKHTFDYNKKGIETKNIIPSDFRLDFTKLSKDHFKYFFLNKINFKILEPSKMFYGLMINDNKEATVWFHNPTTKQVTSGIILKDKNVVSGMTDYYNILWNTAKPLSSFLLNQAKREITNRGIKL